MTGLSSILSSGIDKIISSFGEAADSLFTSDEERLEFKAKLDTIASNSKLELEKQLMDYEREITKRWQSDNDNLITRLVRPLSYLWVIFLFSVIILGDGNWNFSIKASYIPVIETLLTTMTIAYFGSRGAEKTIKYFRGKKDV